MWKRYFKFVKLRPGRVVTSLCGEIDFSRDDIPVETIRRLYESDFPYLQITDEGKRDLYGIVPPVEQPEIIEAPIRSEVTERRSKKSRSSFSPIS